MQPVHLAGALAHAQCCCALILEKKTGQMDRQTDRHQTDMP